MELYERLMHFISEIERVEIDVFCEKTGIQKQELENPSLWNNGVSSHNLIVKVKQAYPLLDAHWLYTGVGSAYKLLDAYEPRFDDATDENDKTSDITPRYRSLKATFANADFFEIEKIKRDIEQLRRELSVIKNAIGAFGNAINAAKLPENEKDNEDMDLPF